MGTLYAPSRIFYSQARAGYLPAALGRVHPRTHTPMVGIILVWAVSVGLVVWGVRDFDYYYEAYSLQLVLAWMVSWALALVAAVRYRRKFAVEVAGLPWRQPLYPLFPVLGLVGIAVVTWYTAADAPLTPAAAGGWLAALGTYYWVGPRRWARAGRRP
jgi:APA family basic amino acid/polyamine antiporter/D-serine/D-alanine/glycine transporter/ethanolamine permease